MLSRHAAPELHSFPSIQQPPPPFFLPRLPLLPPHLPSCTPFFHFSATRETDAQRKPHRQLVRRGAANGSGSSIHAALQSSKDAADAADRECSAGARAQCCERGRRRTCISVDQRR